ncbi:MAG TPA: TolC family protein, partial [Spirochaetia bacterium]|nr:TolC family protein [Spirochaetia bacterium]
PDENLLQPELRFEEPGSPQELYRNNPAIRQTELAAEDARLNRIIDGANDASTLTLSFTVSPRYPYSRPGSKFLESFTDFADEMAGYDLGIKSELKVPLYNGAKWKHRVAADRATELSLQQEAAYQKSNLLQALRMLLLRRENLQERILLLEDNIKLKKKQAEVGRALVEVGQIAELDVIEIEIEYFVKENELEKAKMDLYLTTLDILSLMGRDLGEVIVG